MNISPASNDNSISTKAYSNVEYHSEAIHTALKDVGFDTLFREAYYNSSKFKHSSDVPETATLGILYNGEEIFINGKMISELAWRNMSFSLKELWVNQEQILSIRNIISNEWTWGTLRFEINGAINNILENN